MNTFLTAAAASIITLASLLVASPTVAQSLSVDTTAISDTALSRVQGRIAVNMTAGDSNLQANGVAIAIGNGARAGSSVDQQLDATSLTPPAEAVAVIGDRAFAHAVGLLSVNQASGTGNLQVNSVAIGLGFDVEAVSESRLSGITSRIASGVPGTGSRVRNAAIADTAFEGARGLVQVNQAAGSGNSTANHFALIVQ